MAIYHLSIKTISRSQGRSATAASAYRAGAFISCEREGKIHDYTNKQGVLATEIVLPQHAPDWADDRALLWNAAEAAETRRNSTVAREFEVALPSELNLEQQRELVRGFAVAITARHECAVDVAIHAPSKGGDQRNVHAHLLLTTRRLGPEGFTEKTRELDCKSSCEVGYWREAWSEHVNTMLREHQIDARVDHRSLKEQGIDREPTVHLGPHATALERQGIQTQLGKLNEQAQLTEPVHGPVLDSQIEMGEHHLELLQRDRQALIQQRQDDRALLEELAQQFRENQRKQSPTLEPQHQRDQDRSREIEHNRSLGFGR